MRAMLLFAAAALAWGCVRTVVVPPLQNVAVRGFVAHAEREWPGTAQQQAQTADTLDWLASAVQSLASTKQLSVADLSSRLQEFRALIKEFAAGDPERVDQTRVLRRTLAAGATLVEDLALAAGLDTSGSVLRETAESLDLMRVPRRQPDTIERYFQRASDILQRIDRGA